jgi:hypothetical protein
MTEYNISYIANSDDGHIRVWVTLDLTPFLADGGSEYQAAEQACEIFERNCNNF